MAQHIQKGKYFRCQSCRLVFESESFRARHELEMHGRQKWSVPEFYPKVPKNVKVWVRGEVDTRSKLLSIEEVEPDQACRALCLNDCTDPDNTRKSRDKTHKAKGKEIFVPRDQLVAPKAFKEEILFGKTRSQRRTEVTGKKDVDHVTETDNPMRNNTLLNHISELLFLLDDEALPHNNIQAVTNLSVEPDECTEIFKVQKCYECDTDINTQAELTSHYTESPLKHYRGNFVMGLKVTNLIPSKESHCAVAFERYKRQFVNGPSLQSQQIKESWTDIGRNLLSSYPKGAQCICGKVDWDFGNTNSIAKHLIYNPTHYVKIAESAAHRENVKNKIHSQRIRRLIQSGYQTEQKIDRGSDCPPIAYAKNVYIPRDLLDEDLNRHGVLALGAPEKQPEDPILCSIRSRIKVRKRTDRSVKDNTAFVQEASDRRRFRIAASGVDLEGNIISKESEMSSVSRKDERRITSVLHKANVERQARMQQLNQQQQLQQQVLQHLRTENERRVPQNGNVRKIQPNQSYQNNTNRLDGINISMQRNLIGKKRTAIPAAQPARKMTTAMMQYRQKVLPIQPADVKFPVVTHKEIQVEIVPSEDARLKNNIDKYEIEFKGRKTPNKYNVKPNIKIVKLIGLQSDTEYLIKVFAIRNNIRSEPIMKRVKTTPLPRGHNTGVISDVIELD